MFVIQHQPHGSLAHLRGKLVRRLAHDGSNFSGVGASGKLGAVQSSSSRGHARGQRHQWRDNTNDLLHVSDDWLLVAYALPSRRGNFYILAEQTLTYGRER